MSDQPVLLWDLPTRLFHWSLTLLVAGAFLSGQLGGDWIDWHASLGLATTGLLAFRLVWGIVGSTYARFAQFFPTPRRTLAYLRGKWRGCGHNPLGALSILAMIGLLLLQITSGLFTNDDITFEAPLYALVDKGTSDALTGWHRSTSTALLVMIASHLAAILFYTVVKRRNLIRPMFSGRQSSTECRPAKGGGPGALMLAFCAALGALYLANGSWLNAALGYLAPGL